MRIGDKIEKVANAIGISPCGGCKRRKEILNGLTWKEYRKRNPKT